MMKTKTLIILHFLFYIVGTISAQQTIQLQPGEKIWSGVIKHGDKMPLPDNFEFDFYGENLSNQTQPLLLSNKGLYVWSEEPFKFEINGDIINISNN